MPVYRIHRLKENQREQFRWAPHTSGEAKVKRKDYIEDGTIEAATPYAAWSELRGTEKALQVGDLLETEEGALFLCKYVGFENACWHVSEPSNV